MNKTILIGNICNELELRKTNNNKEICKFSIAINQQERTDFITCVVFGKQAINLCNYQKKGNKVAVEGSLRVDTYKDNEGKTRYNNYVLVNNIEYLSSKQETKETQADPIDKLGNSFKAEEIDDLPSDLPF